MNLLNGIHAIMNVDPYTQRTSFSVGLDEENLYTYDTKKEALAKLGELLQQIKNEYEKE